MAEVTGIIGNEQVELNNAATEASLKALLAATKQLNQSILKMAPASGQAGPGASKGAQVLDKSLTDLATGGLGTAGKALGAVGKAAGLLGAVLGGLMVDAVATGKNLTALGEKALDGQARMSDMFTAFKDLPLGLGVVAGLFEKLAKFQEANLDSYRKLTDAGVNFGGSLTQLRQAALDSYLTLDQFENLVKKNSASFARMGNSTDDGAKAFVKLSKDMINSDIGNTLLATGHSFEQINNSTASYIKMTGGRSAEEMKNTKQLSAAAGEYMLQLDGLAQLTGKSREAQEKEMEEASANAAFEAAMQGMDEEGRKKAMVGLQQALAAGGKGGADAFKSKVMGLPPMTEAARTFTAVMSDTAKGIEKSAAAVGDASKTTDDVRKAGAEAMIGNRKDAQRLGKDFVAVASFMGDGMGEAVMSAQKNTNMLNKMGIKNAEEYMAKVVAIGEKQKAVRESEANAVAQADKAMKELGSELMAGLSPVIKALTPAMSGMVKAFSDWIKSVDLEKMGKDIGKFAEGILDYMKNLFSEDGRNKIMNDIKYGFKMLMIEIKRAILPDIMYSEADAERDRAKLGIEKESFDRTAEAAKLESDSAVRRKAIALDGDKELQKIAKLEVETAEKRKKELDGKKAAGEALSADEQKEYKEKQDTIRVNQAALSKLNDKGQLLDKEKMQQQEAEIVSKKAEGDKLKGRSDELKEGDKTVSGKSGALAGAASLGLAGAAIGSVVPVLGTAIGAAIGAAIGGVAGGLGMIDYGVKGSKVTDAETDKFNKKDLPDKAKAADGGLFSGPKSGYNIMLHGDEAVVPMDQLNNMMKSALPPMTNSAQQFSALTPDSVRSGSLQSGQKSLETDSGAASKKSAMDDFILNFGKTVSDKVTGVTNNLTTAHMTAEQGKNLITELQTLNKQTVEVLRYIRDTAEYTKKTVDATKSLGGNLFAS